MNIIIPAAGEGKRFKEKGFETPKPFLSLKFDEGKVVTMLETVMKNFGHSQNHNTLIIFQKKVENLFSTQEFLKKCKTSFSNTKIFWIDGLTEGAACTVLELEKDIDNDESLFIVNSDQLVDWSSQHFFDFVKREGCDGAVLTFPSNHPKWSYARICPVTGNILEIREKEVISEHATVGAYYWKKGSDFVKFAKEMISKNDRVKGEFYVAPVYNYAVKNGKRIIPYPVPKMIALGTPEDYESFNEKNNKEFFE